MSKLQDFKFLELSADQVAPRLLGCIIERQYRGKLLRGRIVETEAYDQTDAASHSYKGQTPRTAVMFGPAGFLYVYFTYGLHYCCNIVTGPEGNGAAVLIRALEPIDGLETMQCLRGSRTALEATNGPAKLCQAFAIDKKLQAHDLQTAPLRLLIKKSVVPASIVQTTRIGISQAKNVPWRFYIKDNPYVSKLGSAASR